MKNLHISKLHSGGLITNYFCSSKCRHCLYGCGPEWEKRYIEQAQVEKNLLKVKSLGCTSVHIGGGEPFLRPEALSEVLRVARKVGVSVEYVETNSSWYKDENEACGLLDKLKSEGLDTILVSVSPFHNEFIPFKKIKGVINACRITGVNIFPWLKSFVPETGSFDENKTHSLDEYEKRFGDKYVIELISRYGLTMRGRALKTYAGKLNRRSVEEILKANDSGCYELADISHFHVDLFGNYIPGLCTGLSIAVDDLGSQLEMREYPILNMLYDRGINAFLEFAVSNYGFQPADEYLSKCELCFEIRRHLVLKRRISSKELQPVEFYSNV
ncbi:MAG TPA: radical SAM protein [Lentisphaeria bacterium]|nr:MAG: radical SAM protein [Lentisphaerae bacterium GWF2_50_93]HCE46976.1 radical SAM protein [Lentisphaeria bacterium]